MKRYIKYICASEVDVDVSMFAGTPFKPTTDTSYYDNFLNSSDLDYMQRAKNRTGEIVMMSPESYFENCANYGFGKQVSAEDLKTQRRYDDALNEQYKKAMASGDKFPLCYLNRAEHSQEGLHRMMVAGDLYGWDTEFPVLVVDVYDQGVEDEKSTLQEIYDFKLHDFDGICRQAIYSIARKHSSPPDNFVDLLKKAVIKSAKSYDMDTAYDIDVEVDLDEVDGESRALVYLTRYFDYTLDGLYEPEELWLANYFG